MSIPWFKSFFLVFVTVVVAVFCAGCVKKETSLGVAVWSTVLPQKYFIERVGGGLVSVEVLVRPGESPEMYAPSAAQIAQLAHADVYSGIGMPIEVPLFKRMRSSMHGVRIVQTGGDPAAHHDHLGHDHANHDCSENDPHIWLDPVQMVALVEQVRDVFVELEPTAADEFRENADVLIAELMELDAAVRQQLAAYAGRAFFINHPALGHFAKRYGLVQMSIEQSGTTPSAGRIADLIALAREARVGAIFTQPEFGRTTATILADALDIEVVELNLLSTDYIANMHVIADSLEESFAQ